MQNEWNQLSPANLSSFLTLTSGKKMTQEFYSTRSETQAAFAEHTERSLRKNAFDETEAKNTSIFTNYLNSSEAWVLEKNAWWIWNHKQLGKPASFPFSKRNHCEIAENPIRETESICFSKFHKPYKEAYEPPSLQTFIKRRQLLAETRD